MRKAINITETREQTISLGRIERKELITTRMVAIDNYGQMSSSSFIVRLIEKGRLDYSYMKKRTHTFTNEFLTKLLNDNEDIFEVQF